MAQTLTEWLNGEVKELSKLPVGELSNTFFLEIQLGQTILTLNIFIAQQMELLYIKKLFNLMRPL
jgi:hypothetical protein